MCVLKHTDKKTTFGTSGPCLAANKVLGNLMLLATNTGHRPLRPEAATISPSGLLILVKYITIHVLRYIHKLCQGLLFILSLKMNPTESLFVDSEP